MIRDYETKVEAHKLTLNGHSVCPFCGETGCNDQFPTSNGMKGYHVKCTNAFQPFHMVYGKHTKQKKAKRFTVTTFIIKINDNPILKAYLLYNGYTRLDSRTFSIECYSYNCMKTLNEARTLFPNDVKEIIVHWFDDNTKELLQTTEFKNKGLKEDIVGYAKVIKADLEGIATSHTTDSTYFKAVKKERAKNYVVAHKKN